MKIVLGQVLFEQAKPWENMARVKKCIETHPHADVIIFPSNCVEAKYQEALCESAQTMVVFWGDTNQRIHVIQEGEHYGTYRMEQGRIYDDVTQEDITSQPIITLHGKTIGFDACDITIRMGFDDFAQMPAKDCGTDIYVNPVGVLDDGSHIRPLVGGSFVKGHYYANTIGDPECSFVDTEALDRENHRSRRPKLAALIAGIRHFDRAAFPFKPVWVVGVSGGLDSALSTALLTLALGEDRVYGVIMPSEFTKEQSITHAKHVLTTLGVAYEIINIEPLVQASVQTLKPVGEVPEGLVLENIQARVRGHLLMSVASMKQGVVSNNGNKLEVALGYATMYGDSIGALGLLSDLTKLEVGQIAQDINTKFDQEIIPYALIPEVQEGVIQFEVLPSAELAHEQVDPMKWGYHDGLLEVIMKDGVEAVLQSYLKDRFESSPLAAHISTYGLQEPQAFIQDLEWFMNHYQGSVYKRVQAPPMLVISRWTFDHETQLSSWKTPEVIELINTIKKLTVKG